MAGQVLVVEDSHAQAERVRLELERLGLHVDVATTGNDGIAVAQATCPDVVILDIDLPDMDGYRVCCTLKENPQTAHIPIIMLTRYDNAHDTVKGLQVGAVDYIPKDVFYQKNLMSALHHLGIV